MRSHWPALVLALLCGACQPGSPADWKSEPIVGGTRDITDPAAVLILIQNNVQNFLCSGTIVSPHVVLTAAHCVDDALNGPGYTWYVYYGSDFRATDGSQDIARTTTRHFDPKYDPQYPELGHDIGVVITSSALTATPLAMNRTPLGPETIGRTARVIGFGDSIPGQPNTTEIRRQATATIATVDDKLISYSWNKALACNGDSGGPLLMTIHGNEVIVGVHSFVDGTPADCKGPDSDTRLDVYAASFVDPIIAEADPGFVQPDLGFAQPDLASPAEAGAVPDSAGAPAPEAHGCALAQERSAGRSRGKPMALVALLALGLIARRRRRHPRPQDARSEDSRGVCSPRKR